MTNDRNDSVFLKVSLAQAGRKLSNTTFPARAHEGKVGKQLSSSVIRHHLPS